MELSYLDAYYYMLLLEVGFKEDVNNWINLIAEEKNSLDGIYLDLVCNLGDNNKVISCLHNYIGEKEVEANAVGVRARKEGDIGAMPIKDFIQKMSEEVKNFNK